MHRVATALIHTGRHTESIDIGWCSARGYRLSEKEIETRKKIYKKKGWKWTGSYEDNGMHEDITQFLKQSMNPQKGADSKDFKGLVAWYYLNTFNGQSILSFASNDELVFRVPVSELKANAVACLEQVPHDRGQRTWHPDINPLRFDGACGAYRVWDHRLHAT